MNGFAKKIILLWIPVAILISFSGDAHSEIYQWVDENGIVHFSDSPAKVPRDQNVRIMKEARESAPSYPIIPASYSATPSGSGSLDKMIREKEDQLDRLTHNHRNETTILSADLGAKEKELETCTRFPLPEVRYGKTYDRDRRHRDRLEQERRDAREAVRQAQLAIEREKSRYQNDKERIERELWQLKSAQR